MKPKYFFPLIIGILFIGNVNSQIIPSVTRVSLQKKDRDILDQHLREYAVFRIDKRELINNLYTNGRCKFQIYIDEGRNWIFDLVTNDMRASDFRQTYTTNEGEFEYKKPFIVNTFKGTTYDNKVARFTIDENTFFGIILYDRYHYVIRPAKDYTRNSIDESLIVYKTSDIIVNEGLNYINDDIEIPNNMLYSDIGDNLLRNTSPCRYYLKIAIDADYEFFEAMEYNETNAYTQILSALNLVEGVYESTFNMSFIVGYQHIYTTPNNPYTSTDINVLLDQFCDYWNVNRIGVSRNIAHLFTGKNFGLYGMAAGLGKINDNLSYSITRNRIGMYKTTAHEIGHNLNAEDANLMTPVPLQCDCNQTFNLQSLASVMCQGDKDENLWFCDVSINQILTFIQSKRLLLIGDMPVYLSLGQSEINFHHIAVETITSEQVIVREAISSYLAGIEIVLLPGFHAEKGSIFSAVIEECTGLNRMTNEMIIYEKEIDSESEETILQKLPTESNSCECIENGESAKIFSFSVFPNPTSDFVTIDYTMNIDAPIFIELYNMFGQRLKLIVPQQNQKAGTYSVQISVGDLGIGTYIVRATSGKQIESKQLVIN